VAAAVLLVVAGCTGDSAAPTTSSTTPSTSTTEPTTSSTTTTATTSTTDPLSDVEAEVEAAYLRSYEVFVECYRTLPDCDPNEVFPEVYAPPTLAAQILGVLQTKDEGLVYGPPEDPDHARTEVFEIRVDDDSTMAVVTYCTFAADQEYSVNANGDRTQTDDNGSVLVEWGDAAMLLGDDGVWRLSEFVDETGEVVEFPLDELDQRLSEGKLCGGLLDG